MDEREALRKKAEETELEYQKFLKFFNVTSVFCYIIGGIGLTLGVVGIVIKLMR